MFVDLFYEARDNLLVLMAVSSNNFSASLRNMNLGAYFLFSSFVIVSARKMWILFCINYFRL